MSFLEVYSSRSSAPDNIADFLHDLPMDEQEYPYYESPTDWADEVLYFLLPDRFSDEVSRPLLSRIKDLSWNWKMEDWIKKKEDWINYLNSLRGSDWRWDNWSRSGKLFQGGTIKGMTARLDYLKKLGITAVWVGPIFKQRDELDTYHGYGIQNFLEVDSRFGTREDLVDFVKAAHKDNIRVILDIVFNHMGSNFTYQNGETDTCPDGSKRDGINEAKYKPYGGQPDSYSDIKWRDEDDMVLPKEFQDKICFTRAGTACDLGFGTVDDPNAVHKRTDFCDLRDFDTSKPPVLDNLIKVFQYWIVLTDCDGFRVDTTKHVTWDQAADFCGAIKEYAQSIGKNNFFLVGEIAGGDDLEDFYLDTVGQNLDAALDIGGMNDYLKGLAKGLKNPQEYFDNFRPEGRSKMGTHRNMRNKIVSIMDQHDDHIRFSSYASHYLQVVAGTAVQLFTLGIPCIYYGTEQAFSGPPEEEVRKNYLGVNDEKSGDLRWGNSDIYAREAMFGPENPRKRGREEDDFPGFGPFGTSGYHCFDEGHPAYKRIAALIAVRQNPKYKVLRKGRQYQREIATDLQNLNFKRENEGGKLIAWSRIHTVKEYLCVVNSNGTVPQSAAILVDAKLSPPGSKMYVIANTEEVGFADYAGRYPVGTAIEVQTNGNTSYITIEELKPSEVIILANHQ